MTQYLLQNALQSCQAGNLDEGARICREILQSDPCNPGALQLFGLIHARRGEFGQAAALFDRALGVMPGNAEILLNRGNALFELRRLSEALASYDAALASEPKSATSWNNRGNALEEMGRTGEAIASFSKAIEIDPRYIDALASRADLFSATGQHRDALRDLDQALSVAPDNPEIHCRRGVLLLRTKAPRAALNSFDRALTHEPSDPRSHIGRAMALVVLERSEDALAALDLALRFAPDNIVAISNRASVLSRLKRYEDALISADQAVKLEPRSPAAWHNRGTALAGLQRPAEALSAYEKALSLDPQNHITWRNSAISLISLGRHDTALAHLARALEIDPADPETWSTRAKVLANLKRFTEAIESCAKPLGVDPDYVPALRIAIHSRLRTCDWSRREEDRNAVAAGLASGRRLIDPLDCLSLFNSGAENLSTAKLWTAEESPPAAISLWDGARYGHQRIRICYLSTDFRAHAVGFLIAGVFEHHDKRQFDTTAVSYGPDDGSRTRSRIAAACDRFIDARGISDLAVARLVRELEIDILVDLNGYTGDMRTGIAAFRPAPVQVNFLGYPGTMASTFMDYIIADRTLNSGITADILFRADHLSAGLLSTERPQSADCQNSSVSQRSRPSGVRFCLLLF